MYKVGLCLDCQVGLIIYLSRGAAGIRSFEGSIAPKPRESWSITLMVITDILRDI